MKILFLEDNAAVVKSLQRGLEKQGHSILLAYDLDDASYYVEAEDEAIDCCIIDLNVGVEGLTEEERNTLPVGRLAGWIWFMRIVRNNPKYLKRSIIYSAYLDILDDHSELIDGFEEVIRINKRDLGSTRKLLHAVKSVEKQIVIEEDRFV